MIGSISARQYWPKMAADIWSYVKQCQTCQACKIVTRNLYGYIWPLAVPEYYWQHITMDLITCLPKTEWSIDTIATFIDQLSKYTYFVPVSTTISVDELAQVFLAIIVALHGVLDRLILDGDPRFVLAFGKSDECSSVRFRPQNVYCSTQVNVYKCICTMMNATKC